MAPIGTTNREASCVHPVSKVDSSGRSVAKVGEYVDSVLPCASWERYSS